MKKAILFDLDGTLWDSAAGVSRAWSAVMAQNGRPEGISVAGVHALMGKQMDEIARLLFPDRPAAEQAALLKACCAEEHRVLAAEGGVLYPRLAETLTALKKDYFLAIVSNCQSGYIETFLTAHSLWDWFDDRECYGNTGLSKGENIALVARRNGLAAVYLGDTRGDCDAAHAAGVPFLHAAYGFGRVEGELSTAAFADLPVFLREHKKELWGECEG